MLKTYHTKGLIEAGCDEAGRGCLAGPVVAAAVIFPPNYKNKFLDDSKKLTDKQRYDLRPIVEKDAIAYAIGIVSNEEIDEINILNASFLAMHRALDELDLKPQSILVDGNRFNDYLDVPHHCIVKGDSKFLSIAGASILAKTYRDDIMKMLHLDYPEYGWNQNMGYPTKKHRATISKIGTNEHFRMSFKLLPD